MDTHVIVASKVEAKNDSKCVVDAASALQDCWRVKHPFALTSEPMNLPVFGL